MNDSIPQPQIRWPALPEKYDWALREAVDYIMDRVEPVGLVAAGSVLRGMPDRGSDLDLYVIHLAPFRQRIQKYFAGVPAEIFINPPAAVYTYFEDEFRSGRPITANMLVTGYIMLEKGSTLAELRRAAAACLYRPIDKNPESLTYARYIAASRLEDAIDVVERDPATASMLLSEAVVDMLNYLFRREGRFYPRGKDLIEAAARMDATIGGLAQKFFSAASLSEKVDLAGQIADRIIQARGFFEWESSLQDTT